MLLLILLLSETGATAMQHNCLLVTYFVYTGAGPGSELSASSSREASRPELAMISDHRLVTDRQSGGMVHLTYEFQL